jgi:hypothetical protein
MLLFVTRETVLVNGLPIVNLINRLIENYYGGKTIESFIHMKQWVAHYIYHGSMPFLIMMLQKVIMG